jgi:putative transposase
LAGIPERTYRRRLATLRAGNDPIKGPWPTPAVDAVEALAAKYASDWPAWRHRKIAVMMRADGHAVSTSTVERALRRCGLLLPRGFRAALKARGAPVGVPFRTQHPLGAVVNRPSVWSDR